MQRYTATDTALFLHMDDSKVSFELFPLGGETQSGAPMHTLPIRPGLLLMTPHAPGPAVSHAFSSPRTLILREGERARLRR